MVCMHAPWAVRLVVLLVLFVAADAAFDCHSITTIYHDRHHREPLPFDKDGMVYFLHIPRTAGRTFDDCLLRPGVGKNKHCPNSWDHLRIDTVHPNCSLLSSHDDFSVVAMLPDDVSVISHFRDPLDRLLSAYEFAVEVAARDFWKEDPNLPPPSTEPGTKKPVETTDVWPWSYLVPFFQKDMRERSSALKSATPTSEGNWIEAEVPQDANKPARVHKTLYFNKVKGISKWELDDEERTLLLPPLDPYDNPLYLSLADFAASDIAAELLHNGQTFQVLGVTNYSHYQDAADMRSCIWSSGDSMQLMLDLALARADKFVHVGTTERLEESVEAAAVELRFDPLSMAADGAKVDVEAKDKEKNDMEKASDQTISDLNTKVTKLHDELSAIRAEILRLHEAGSTRESRAKMPLMKQMRVALQEAQAQLRTARVGRRASKSPPAEPLGALYQRCQLLDNNRNQGRRSRSFAQLYMPHDGRGVEFTKAKRKGIPEAVLDAIRARNTMDAALHAKAETMLSERLQQYEADGLLDKLPQSEPFKPPKQKALNYKIPLPEDEAQEL